MQPTTTKGAFSMTAKTTRSNSKIILDYQHEWWLQQYIEFLEMGQKKKSLN